MKPKKIKRIILILLLMSFVSIGYAQSIYKRKIEVGFLQYQYNSVQVEPGPNWMGYHLNGESGIDLNFIYGAKFHDKLFTGIGFGYLNFRAVNGFSVFQFLNIYHSKQI